jgi:hypothetical protein
VGPLQPVENSWPTDPAQARPVTAAEDAHEQLTEAAARRRAIAATPGAAPEDHERARRALDDALDAYAAAPSEAPEPEPVAAPGTREDSRPQAAPMQVSGLPEAGTARPDEREEPEPYRVPPQAPRSMAAGVRELRAAKVADPEVMAARLSALMGKDVPVTSVKREIRRQVAAEAKGDGTGAYL